MFHKLVQLLRKMLGRDSVVTTYRYILMVTTSGKRFGVNFDPALPRLSAMEKGSQFEHHNSCNIFGRKACSCGCNPGALLN